LRKFGKNAQKCSNFEEFSVILQYAPAKMHDSNGKHCIFPIVYKKKLDSA